MADIFLSYASEDRERVSPLVEMLEAEGFSVWWDRRIGIGSSFDREIERELNAAKCVVTVWSDTSIESDWVRVESQEGMDRGILVPVCIDDVQPPLAFRRVQAADLSQSDSQAASAFLHAVARTAAVTPAAISPKPTLPAPQQKSGSPLLVTTFLVLIVIVGGLSWWWTQREVAKPVMVEMVTPLRSVVVMPFENQGSSLDKASIDALHGDVIDYMGRDGYLKMIGRSIARRLQSRGESLATIAEETDASHVVEVALRAAGANTKVSINLIQTDTKSSVWSFSFDEPLDDTTESHRRLALKVAGRLWWQIKTWQRLTKQTVDQRAFELVAIGMDMPAYGPELIEIYEQALAIQPDFYDALEDLSLAYCIVPPPHGGIQKCLDTAQKLIDLKPNNPRSYETMGERLMSPSVNRWEDAVRQFKKAEALDDDFTSLGYAAGLMAHGYAEQSVVKLRKYRNTSPLDAGRYLARALLATNRPAEAREFAELHTFVMGEPAYDDPWGIPLSYVFENNYPSAVQALRSYYDLLGDSGAKNQSSTGHVLLARILRDLGDSQTADHWLARAAARFGDTNATVLNEHFTIAILEQDVVEVEKGAQAFLELYGVDVSKWVAITQALRDSDVDALRKMSMDNSQRASIPFNYISTILLFAGVVDSDELTANVIDRVRNYYADGGGTWGIGGDPDAFTMPGEGRKQFDLAMSALLENDWAQAMSHFERGFEVGLRAQWRLAFFSLIKDQHEIYDGFVDSTQWKTFMAKVDSANEDDLKALRAQFPELFLRGR